MADESKLRSLIVPQVREILESQVTESDFCLELACGPGQYRLVVPGKYLGSDLTPQDYKPGFPRRVDVVADAQALPFKNERFDVVFIVAAFYQIPDTQAVLREVHRILRPRGRFLIFDYNCQTTRRLKKQEAGGMNMNHVWSPWALRKAIRRAGFRAEIVDLYPADIRPEFKRRLLSFGFVRSFRLLKAQFKEGWNIVIGLKTMGTQTL